MKVTVIGKEYASGTSKKTGKDFAATVVHVSHKKNGVDGTAVDSILCICSCTDADTLFYLDVYYCGWWWLWKE